ncbi:uroporphyrinogen decarboxylase family protein [Actinomadura verrucosospora]|uniref:Uroporphyrinogen decarboxylase (URO-D) n=1 Tax=Actinomadura verrucosospora TaxID=46165 RepID=A0A7D3ZLS6_ACTVE|nr:uroporphyrinogen decarboxylase family protein [Actinomadura verrucosospora]QKG21562.1 uroporphyrinogen decarboxylase (URO-D) [Actinomadura verrucosospora]
MTGQMTHRERLYAALACAEVDRTPISLWRHFGGIDMTAAGLSDAMVGLQTEYDFDFVKFMPTGTYPIMDWGGETVWEPNHQGIRTVVSLPVSRPADWERLVELDTSRGMLGIVNEALARTIERLGPDTPVFQTIFSPLTTARKLAGPAALAHLRQEPAAFAAGMHTIAAVTERLIADAIDRGADIFYAVQNGSAELLARDEFMRWEFEYAQSLLRNLPASTRVILHSHGDHLWFDELADWPVDGINWDGQEFGLAKARERTTKSLLGGIPAQSVLRNGTTEEVRQTVIAAMADVSRGLVITPGCVVATDTAPHLMRAARAAVDAPRSAAA